MLLRAVAATLTVATVVPAFAQNTIYWNTAGARLAGSKNQGGVSTPICSIDGDTFLIGSGDQLTVILTGLGVQLPSGDSALTARANCRLAVPVEAARGRYAADLEQTVTYGLVKGTGSSISVSAKSTFFGYPVNPLNRLYRWGTVLNIPLETATRVDRFLVDTRPGSWWYRWCGIRPKGVYTADLAVAAEKNSFMDDAQASIDGLDVRFTVAPGNYISCSAPGL
jgi:hypothetical protein